ncbi:MAG TPA: hypothetical protein VFD60_04990 [Nitrososphaeraceae archaeon]|jgi:hypothetical protein|nr:hypothetical protein [Nitrososphaeraceae archaeon]
MNENRSLSISNVSFNDIYNNNTCLSTTNQRCRKCLSIDRCSIREKDKMKTGDWENNSVLERILE